MRRAVFLDKDGTLVEDVPYNVDPALIRLTPGAVEGLRLLHRAGYRLFVVSNQSGVGRGFFPESALEPVAARLGELLAEGDVPLAGFVWCPHRPEDGCACRKPQPGMLLRLAEREGIDPVASWMVGDILDDVEAGRRAGCRTILLDNGHETEWVSGELRVPHHRAADLAEAAHIILTAERRDHAGGAGLE